MFSLFRCANYIYYFDIYSRITPADTFYAFLDGIRFDFSIFFTFSGIFLLLILLPLKKNLIQKTAAFFIIVLLNIYFILLSADLIFFEHVKRHLSDEILLIGNDLFFFVDYLKGNYTFYLITAALLTVNVYLIKKIFLWIDTFFKTCSSRSRQNTALNTGSIVLFIAVSVFFIRGTPTGTPINIIDAFTKGSNEYGNLVLNGVFTAYHSSRVHNPYLKKHLSDEKAFIKASDYLIEDYEYRPFKEYPLTRKLRDSEKREPKDFNIVIILLESWGAEFIDSFSNKNYKVTPNLDRIYKDSLVFDNFYANGQRSIFGITSVLLSIPQIQGLPYLGQGLEVSNIFRAANHFNSRGYRTIAVQSSSRRSYRVSSIAMALGFKEFYGMQDIPIVYPYSTDETPNFGWDYDTFEFLFNKLDSGQKPFFSFIFTGTTHSKFILPDKKFEKYPHDPYKLNGYLNTLFYSDYSLGNFLEKARQTDWFKNTIFFITADHTNGKSPGNGIRDTFGIPLLIYAPGIIEPGVSHKLGSQVDIMPTILDITGSDTSFAGIGKSLLRKSDKRFAFLNKGRVTSFLTDEGRIDIAGSKVVSSSIQDQNKVGLLKENFFALDQSLYQSIKDNKFFKPDQN